MMVQKYYQNRIIQKLIILRKKQYERIDLTSDIKERNPNNIPEKIKKLLYHFKDDGILFGID